MSGRSNVSLRAMPAATEKNPPFIPWNNPDNIISAETAAHMHTFLICGAAEVVMFLGIPGNIINLAVFTRQGLKDRVTLLLFCLALVDLLNLLCYFSVNISCFIHPVDPVLAWNVETMQYPQVLYLSIMFVMLSVTMVTIISVDRCLAISMPLKAARMLTFPRTVITTATISVTIIVMNLPGLWYNTVVWVTDHVSNQSIAQVVNTDFALQHPLYGTIARTFRIAIKMGCFLAVVISCSVTVKSLRAAWTLRAKMAENNLQRSEVQITVMLLLVCMVMVICLIPEQVVSVILWAIPDFFMFKRYHNIFLVCQYVIFFAQSLNSSINFFMYATLSSKFRVTLTELLPSRRK